MVILLLLLLYFVPVFIINLLFYIEWFKEDKDGHTVKDFYEYVADGTNIWIVVYCPIINIIFLFCHIIFFSFYYIRKLRIK